MGLRETKRAALRARILAVSGGLFRSEGFDATTVDTIAQGAGVSRQTFFNHFGGKDAVLTELGLEWLRSQAAAPWEGAARAASGSGPVLPGIRRAIAAQARAIEADAAFVRLFVTRSSLFAWREGDAEPSPHDPVRLICAGVSRVIAQGKAAGEIAPEIGPMRAAEVIVTTMFMTLRMWASGYWPGEPGLEGRLLSTLDILEAGLTARG